VAQVAERIGVRTKRAWRAHTAGVIARQPTAQDDAFFQLCVLAARHYRLAGTYGGPVLVASSTEGNGERLIRRGIFTGPTTLVRTSGDHHDMMREPDVAAVAEAIDATFAAQTLHPPIEGAST
jgi:hypothetical protein